MNELVVFRSLLQSPTASTLTDRPLVLHISAIFTAPLLTPWSQRSLDYNTFQLLVSLLHYTWPFNKFFD